MRAIIGVFVASLVAATEIVAWLAIRYYEGATRTPVESDVLSTCFGLAFVSSLVLGLFVGLPAFYGVKRLKFFNALTSSLAGAAIGCLGDWLIPDVPFLDGVPHSSQELLTQYLIFAVFGFLSGFCFWLIVRSRSVRPQG